MNVYDFDKTIYKRDSTTDFILWLVRKRPSLLRYVPSWIGAWLRLVSGKWDKTQAKERLFAFLAGTDDIDALTNEFWQEKKAGITERYLLGRADDDVVVSASPEFLLAPICSLLGIKTVIASRINKKSGKFTGRNCYGEEKVRRFRKVFPDAEIECFYSDSLSDAPMAALAKKAFLVKGEKQTEW